MLGVTLHGLFESPQAMRALFGAEVSLIDDSFDLLADIVEDRFDRSLLDPLMT